MNKVTITGLVTSEEHIAECLDLQCPISPTSILSRSHRSCVIRQAKLVPLNLHASTMPKKYKTAEERYAAHIISKHRHYTRYAKMFYSPLTALYCIPGIVQKNKQRLVNDGANTKSVR